jgi:hypothetical protein
METGEGHGLDDRTVLTIRPVSQLHYAFIITLLIVYFLENLPEIL